MSGSRLEIGLLGPLEVRVDGEPLTLGAPKHRAVLAMLVLGANRVVPRSRLIDGLWGEEPPETAVKAVQVYVSQVRKLLPEGALATRNPGYVLTVDPEAVDVQRFERLAASARGAEPAAAAELLREALGLWRGPALADLAGEPFAPVEAARLEDMRHASLEERLDADLALGRHAELIGELEVLIAEHPHRERLRGQLMLALYRAGRQADALEAFRAARQALDELGLEPGAALRQLERAILTHDEALALTPRGAHADAAPPTALPGALVPRPPFPFVGRGRELGVLRSLLEQTAAGEGAFVLLAAQAGGGKTRLVREFAHEAAREGALVLYGASDAAVSTPYQPLREWLQFVLQVEERSTVADSLPPGSEALARLVPELAALASAPAAREPDDPEGERFVLQVSATELLRRLGRSRPLVLVADDIHWADDETLQLLRRLARTAAEARMLVVAGVRDRGEELGPAVTETMSDLARLDGVTRLSLANLGDEDVGAFVRDSTHAEASAELVSMIGELTQGTPLLVCELWRDLLERGRLDVSDGGVRLVGPPAELPGLERLRDVVRQRLLRLEPETIATVELAAVAGPRFELRVLAEAGGLEPGALVERIEEASRNGIVEELPEPAPVRRFTHELVRRAIYDRIAPVRRAGLHLRVGEALERVYAANPSSVLPDLAHHFTLGAAVGGPERGVQYNLRAADAAVGAAAFHEASERIATALELGIVDPEERARVQLELSYLLRDSGRGREAKSVLEASVESATGEEGRRVAAHALMLRGESMGDPDSDPARMEASVRRGLATFVDLGDPGGLALAGRRLGMALRRGGRMAESCAALEEALVHANEAGGWTARRQVIGTLAYVLADGPMPAADAVRRCEELRDSGSRDLELEAVVNRSLAALLAMAGRIDEAQELGAASSRLLDAQNFSVHSTVYRVIVAEQKELCGDRAGAEEDLIAKWQWFGRRARVDARAMHAAYHLALVLCDEGRWDEAAQWLEYGRDVPVPDHFLHEAVLGLAARARVAAHGAHVDEALALARRGVALAEQGDMTNLTARTWLALAEVERRNGRASEADAAVAAALHLYDEKGNVSAATRVRAAMPLVAP